MTNREIKLQCYKEALEDEIVTFHRVCNQFNRLQKDSLIIDEKILNRDRIQTLFDLELSLASICILLRKMAENQFIVLSNDMRKDVNSVIHSNRFEYKDDDTLYVYSQKGKEEVCVKQLILFVESVLE